MPISISTFHIKIITTTTTFTCRNSKLNKHFRSLQKAETSPRKKNSEKRLWGPERKFNATQPVHCQAMHFPHLTEPCNTGLLAPPDHCKFLQAESAPQLSMLSCWLLSSCCCCSCSCTQQWMSLDSPLDFNCPLLFLPPFFYGSTSSSSTTMTALHYCLPSRFSPLHWIGLKKGDGWMDTNLKHTVAFRHERLAVFYVHVKCRPPKSPENSLEKKYTVKRFAWMSRKSWDGSDRSWAFVS